MPNKGTVILYVSMGKYNVTMPNLLGMTLDEAREYMDILEEEYGITIPDDVLPTIQTIDDIANYIYGQTNKHSGSNLIPRSTLFTLCLL
jgi:hypothetical protein